MFRRTVLISVNEFRLIAREPAWPIAFTLMPLALMVVLNGAFSRWLIAVGGWDLRQGRPSGAELSVGGQTALFSIMLLANFGLFLYRDYSTGVWDRMRATYAAPREILGGKLAATWCAHLLQYLVLVIAAQLAFGLDVSGHALAVLAIVVCTVTATIALGFAMFSFFASSNAFEATAMMGAMVLGALGGAFAPRQTLPTWSRPLQGLSPVTWTVEGFRRLFVEHRPGASVLVPCLVLLAFAAVLGTAGVVRFNPDDVKAKNR
jgi:ABC-type multidrug transport system permease subunit